MDSLFEDLHWLLLISAYLLADESDGETPLIPRGIMSYSSNLKDQVDLQASLQILCTSQNQSSGSKMIFVLFPFLREQCFSSFTPLRPLSVVAYRFKSLFEVSKPFSVVTSNIALSPQIFPDRILHILNQLSHPGAVRLHPVTSAFSL